MYRYSSEAKLFGGPSLFSFVVFSSYVLGIRRFEGNNSKKNLVPTSVLLFVVCKVINNDLWYLRLYTYNVLGLYSTVKCPPATVYNQCNISQETRSV